MRQIVTQTEQHIVGVDAATGRRALDAAVRDRVRAERVTPVVYGDTVILSGLSKSTFAVRPAKQGDDVDRREGLGQRRDVPMYMSSPVLVGDTLYGFSHRNKGQFFALDARTGRTLWTARRARARTRRSSPPATARAADRRRAAHRGEGDRAALEAVTQVEVATSPTWAHPVLLGNRLLVKDEQTVALLRIG